MHEPVRRSCLLVLTGSPSVSHSISPPARFAIFSNPFSFKKRTTSLLCIPAESANIKHSSSGRFLYSALILSAGKYSTLSTSNDLKLLR
jgi:hypothetical protein